VEKNTNILLEKIEFEELTPWKDKFVENEATQEVKNKN